MWILERIKGCETNYLLFKEFDSAKSFICNNYDDVSTINDYRFICYDEETCIYVNIYRGEIYNR